MNQILILGAGYAGLMTGLKLEQKTHNQKNTKITLIDRNDYHQYLHLSYEIVTGVKKTTDITIPIQELIEKRNIKFHQAEIQYINLKNKTIQTEKGNHPYTHLVIALGSEPNFFNIKGHQNAYCVCSVQAAENIKNQLKKEPNPKIVIGGGGFTGVELAGEIADEFKCCVTIIEATNTLLPTWENPEFSKKATKTLTDMGAQFIFNKCITEIKPNQVTLNDGTNIPFSLFIWTAGVQANHLIPQCGLKTEKNNRATINQYCQAPDRPEVYIIGDSAHVTDPQTNKTLPQCIEIALQQADNVAKNLNADLTNTPKTPYTPKFSGLILAIGEKYGIGKVAGITVEGKIALMAKKVLHLHYIYEISGLAQALEAI